MVTVGVNGSEMMRGYCTLGERKGRGRTPVEEALRRGSLLEHSDGICMRDAFALSVSLILPNSEHPILRVGAQLVFIIGQT